VVDSGTVSAAEGLVALAAARAAAHEGSLAGVALIARSTAARFRMAAVLDSVEFLARGGRMAGAAAVFHTGAPEARDVALRLGPIAGCEPLIARAGQVTGTHLGPRALGLVTVGRVAGASP
jgi:fatty acid-binding protein DegV